MTLEQFQNILNSRIFKSKSNQQSFTFAFTDNLVHRDGERLCEYVITEKDDNFKMQF